MPPTKHSYWQQASNTTEHAARNPVFSSISQSKPRFHDNQEEPQPTDPEWRQYPGTHAKKPKETHSKRRRAGRVDRREEIVEEQAHWRVMLSYLFSPFDQRHPIHYGHSLVVSRTRRRRTGRGHSQRKSVKHNVLHSNDGC